MARELAQLNQHVIVIGFGTPASSWPTGFGTMAMPSSS